MIRKLLLLSFSVVFLWTLSADAKNTNNLQTYYTEVNQAELAIIKDNYKDAIHYYNLAFKNKEKPFAQDLFNLCVCYIKTGRLNQAMVFCKILADKGVGKQFFVKHEIFSRLKKQKDWQELLALAQHKKDEWHQKDKKTYLKLDTLFKQDQAAHWILHYATPKNYDSVSHYVDSVDHAVSMRLMDLFKQNNGILSEFDLGAFLDVDGNITNSPDFYVIIRHAYQGFKGRDTLFNPMLRKSVMEGKIKPIVYANMHDANSLSFHDYYGTEGMFFEVDTKVYVIKFLNTDSIRQIINSTRKVLMMPPVDDYLEKVLFNLKNKGSDFVIVGDISTIGSFANEASKKKFLKSLELVK